MSTIALNTASTGLNALSTSLDLTANNLANVNTAGFKSSRTNFEDLFYLTRAQPGIENEFGNSQPNGLQVGLGVKASGTSLNLTQGSFETTGDAFDLAIQGDGELHAKVRAYSRRLPAFLCPSHRLPLPFSPPSSAPFPMRR